jgi:hypothetical protein
LCFGIRYDPDKERIAKLASSNVELLQLGVGSGEHGGFSNHSICFSLFLKKRYHPRIGWRLGQDLTDQGWCLPDPGRRASPVRQAAEAKDHAGQCDGNAGTLGSQGGTESFPVSRLPDADRTWREKIGVRQAV